MGEPRRHEVSTIPSNWQFDWMAPVYDWLSWHRNWELLDEALDPAGARRILDLGGGTSQLAAHLEGGPAPGAHVVTTDLNRAMLRAGSRKGLRASLVEASALALPFRAGCFQRVFLGDAFHHMPRHGAVLSEANRVLAPDGFLLFEEFDPSRLAGRLVYALERGMGMGSTFFTPDRLRAELREAGFEPTGFWQEGFVYYLRGRPRA